jgi:hypothetical protein
MVSVDENILPRQQRLRIWIIKNGFKVASLVGKAGASRASVHQYLYVRSTMRPEFREACLAAGIPEELLPPPTRPRAEILRENLELRARLAQYETQAQAS